MLKLRYSILLFITLRGALAMEGALLPLMAQEGPLNESVVLSGTIEPLNSNAVKVKWFSLIRKISVQLGQHVRKGDELAQVEVKYLEWRRDYLKSREKFLMSRREQTKIDERYVLAQEKRLRGLASKDIIAKSESEKFTMKVLDARLNVVRTETELKGVEKMIQETDAQITMANYYAPIDGIITELIVNPKQLVGSFMAMPDLRLARIDQPGEYIVKAQAVDTQIAALSVGKSGMIIIEGSGERIPCKIREILGSSRNGLFELILILNKPGPILRRGLTVRAEIPIGESRQVVMLPWNAIHVGPSRATVKLVDGANGWTEREVALGLRGAHRVEIRSGLKPGEVVEASLW